jgi:hypothetical protein
MTLNLSPEEKKERRKEYKKQYSLKYYHYLKENEPEKYRHIVDKCNERKMKKYNEDRGNKPPKINKRTNIKIDLQHLSTKKETET